GAGVARERACGILDGDRERLGGPGGRWRNADDAEGGARQGVRSEDVVARGAGGVIPNARLGEGVEENRRSEVEAGLMKMPDSFAVLGLSAFFGSVALGTGGPRPEAG